MSASEIEEIRKTAEVIEKIAADEKAFKELVEAHDNENAEAFQAVLGRLGVLEHCERICFWICFKKCVLRCGFLCPIEQPNPNQIDVDEMRKFAQEVMRLTNDERMLKSLLEAYDKRDAKAFQEILKRLQLLPYCRQVCSWFCHIKCRRVCLGLCPLPPLITLVGDIPTDQFTTAGFAKGPSDGLYHTAPDDPIQPVNTIMPGGMGDHPFGGSIKIQGLFNVTGPDYYKVEYSTNPADPASWTPITTPNPDRYHCPTCPPGAPAPPYACHYTRTTVNLAPDGDGWYKIPFDPGPPPIGMSDDLAPGGADLTSWITRDNTGTIFVPDGVYYLKLTVKKGAAKFPSPIVKLRVDNTWPEIPQLELFQKGKSLGCCGEIKRGDGEIEIHFKAWDDNFSRYQLDISGSCTFHDHIFWRSYNGDTSDKGETVTKTVTWNPAVITEEGCCCYSIILTILDRAITNDSYSGQHLRQKPAYVRIC